MSLFTILSTAVAVPLLIVLMAFFWFLLRAHLAEKKKANTSGYNLSSSTTDELQVHSSSTPALSNLSVTGGIPVLESTTQPLASVYATSSSDELSYQPIATYLGDTTLSDDSFNNTVENEISTLLPGTTSIQFDIKDIPGINVAIERELYDLGYTSVEQIARWGRADVRAVSATLGVDQQLIEDEWIAGARLILSIR